MPIARLATYELRPGNLDRLVDQAKRELYPEFDKVDGLLSYEIVKAEGNTLISFATFEDQQAADRISKLASDWVDRTMRDEIVRSSFHMGEVAVSRGQPSQV